MTPAAPQVSCVMAVNRDDGFLDEAVRSVLAQEGVEFEFLIVANNCTDELWNKIRAYGDPRIRAFRTGLGQLPFNLNYGIDQARAPLIARMDADDRAHPQRFLKQWCAFQDDPRLGVLGTAYDTIDGKNTAKGGYHPPTDDGAIRRRLRWENVLAHPTVMARTALLRKSRGYAFGLHVEDYELWLRLRRDPDIVFGNLAEALLSYRVHDAQATSHAAAAARFADHFALYLREFWLTGDFVFLLGLARKWFFSSRLWAWLGPRYRARQEAKP